MHLIPKVFRGGRSSRSRGVYGAECRLGIESLELRDMLSGSPIPLQVVNTTKINNAGGYAYQDNQITVAIYAQRVEDGAYFYFDDHGGAHQLTTQSTVPTFTLSDMHAIKNTQHQYVINMPDTMPGSTYGPDSARMYFGFNTALSLEYAESKVQPIVPGDFYYDFVEYTINGKKPDGTPLQNLNINTSTIDQYGAPVHVAVATSTPSATTTVGTIPNRASLMQQFTAFTAAANDHYRTLISTETGTYGAYRINNPSDLLKNAKVENTKLEVEAFLSQAVQVQSGTGQIHLFQTAAFPTPTMANPIEIQIDSEKMLATASTPGAGNTMIWTVMRGYGSTTPAYHSANKIVLPAGAGISASQNTITMPNVTGYPQNPTAQNPFYVRVDDEVMRVVGATLNTIDHTTTWTVVRAQFGTTAVAHYTTGVNSATAYWNSMRDDRFSSMFNPAVDQLFKKYLYVDSSSPGLLLTSNADQNTYVGHVVHSDSMDSTSPYVMRFQQQGMSSGPTYDVYYPFFEQNRYFWGGYTPLLDTIAAAPEDVLTDSEFWSPSGMVFACAGVFGDSGQRTGLVGDGPEILGDLENQMVAALNRGVALIDNETTDSWKNVNSYYGGTGAPAGEIWNRFAQFMHQSTISYGKLAYGFPYDDNNQQSSDIGVGSLSNVVSTIITLGAWASTTPPSLLQNPPLLMFIASNLQSAGSAQSQAAPQAVSTVSEAPAPAATGPTVDAALLSAMSDDTDDLALTGGQADDTPPAASAWSVRSLLLSSSH